MTSAPLNFSGVELSAALLRAPSHTTPNTHYMDARAYLQGLGWRGEGHSLDNHGRGIKKPLLISHKQDQSGLGKKKAAEKISDQWWLRAFDESLQSIGTGKEVRALFRF